MSTSSTPNYLIFTRISMSPSFTLHAKFESGTLGSPLLDWYHEITGKVHKKFHLPSMGL